MKALTISQPYASLISSGEKWVENRKWYTDYRGLLAIHAGKGRQYLSAAELEQYPTGCVVAIAQLVECVFLHCRSNRESVYSRIERAGIDPEAFLAHKHTEGPFCWILKDVQPLQTPIPVVGRQGLWNWELPDDLKTT